MEKRSVYAEVVYKQLSFLAALELLLGVHIMCNLDCGHTSPQTPFARVKRDQIRALDSRSVEKLNIIDLTFRSFLVDVAVHFYL